MREMLELKAAADERVGWCKGRLNQCGPRGNRSVEAELDYNQGRSDAIADCIRLLSEVLEAEVAPR